MSAGADIRAKLFVAVNTKGEEETDSDWLRTQGNPEEVRVSTSQRADFLKTYYTFVFPQKTYLVYFDFTSFVKAVYTNKSFYNVLQPSWCVLFDCALSLGTTEAIAESAYSSLSHHIQAGNQHNATAANRLVVDWATPDSVLAIPLFVEKVAQVLHDSMAVVRKTGQSQESSKVLQRLASQKGSGLLS